MFCTPKSVSIPKIFRKDRLFKVSNISFNLIKNFKNFLRDIYPLIENKLIEFNQCLWS